MQSLVLTGSLAECTGGFDESGECIDPEATDDTITLYCWTDADCRDDWEADDVTVEYHCDIIEITK